MAARRHDETMCLEWADGFFTALAVGPERLPPERYLPAIVGTSDTGPVFDSPAHDAYVAELLGPLVRGHRAQSGRR